SPVRGLAIPPHRLGVVLRDTLTFQVHLADRVLGFGVALVRGLAEQLHRLGVILRYVAVKAIARRVSALDYLRHSQLGFGRRRRVACLRWGFPLRLGRWTFKCRRLGRCITAENKRMLDVV